MSLKTHIVLGTLLGVLLGVGAVAVLSRTASPGASSAEASESRRSESPEDAVSPAALRGPDALRGEFLGSDVSRPMRPGAKRRSLRS